MALPRLQLTKYMLNIERYRFFEAHGVSEIMAVSAVNKTHCCVALGFICLGCMKVVKEWSFLRKITIRLKQRPMFLVCLNPANWF